MITPSDDPPSVILSNWVYTLLLFLYPIPFRREYGPQMAQVFRDCCLKAYRQAGLSGMLSLWAITLIDWFKTVIEEQLQRGTQMSRSKFIRLSGWGLFLSGFSILFGFLASNMDAVLSRSLTGIEYNRYETISNLLLVAGILLLVVGFVGLFVRYGDQVGQTGKITLAAGIFFGLSSLVGAWVMSIFDGDWGWTVWFLSFTMVFVCLAFFGVLTIRQKLLPRWNSLPLLAGLGIPLFVLASVIWEQINGGWTEFDNSVGLVIVIITAVSIGLLGFTLQGDPPREISPA